MNHTFFFEFIGYNSVWYLIDLVFSHGPPPTTPAFPQLLPPPSFNPPIPPFLSFLAITPVWDLIKEFWGFCVDLHLEHPMIL